MDMVVRLQRDVEAMKARPQLGNLTLGGPASQIRSKPVMFTSTKVPIFAGVTSWEQVFDAIAQSNGWDDATQLSYNCCLTWRVMR